MVSRRIHTSSACGYLPSTLEDSAVAYPRARTLDHHITISASELRQHPDRWERHPYDFNFHENPVPPPLVHYRKYQQDAMRATWEGLVAGTDGIVDKCSERMGAGYAIGDRPIPIRVFKPLWAAPCLQSDQKRLVSSKSCVRWPHQNPKDVLHFDIMMISSPPSLRNCVNGLDRSLW